MKIHAAHASMQSSDTAAQKEHDSKAIFEWAHDEGVAWITGTEAGQVKSPPLPGLLRKESGRRDYRLFIRRGEWVAIHRSIVQGDIRVGWIPTIPSNAGGKHTERGILWARWNATNRLGPISVGACHYLTKGRRPGDPNYQHNRKTAKAIGRWAKSHGKGEGLVFYGGDQEVL